MIKHLIIIVSIVSMLGLTGCGGGSDEYGDLDQPSTGRKAGKRVRTTDLRPEDRPKNPQGWFKKISFSDRFGRKGTKLKVKVQTTLPLEEDQHFSYIYWKNGEKLEETASDSLDPSKYKKGDVIFADVALYQGDRLIEQRRSDMLLISNSSPVIDEVEIPDIDGPGLYRFPVKAHDPDGDRMTFSLEGKPLPEGLEIDPASGLVTFFTTEKAPPKSVKFNIKADDGDGGVTKKTVSMKFKITQPEEK